MSIGRLNHAVLWVRDANRTAEFFVDLLGFVKKNEMAGAVFLKCSPDSKNDHDLGVFSVGDSAHASSAGKGAVGMYHLAWEVPTLGELKRLRQRLIDVGALVGESDHGESKSLYCEDPDGLEFELMWAVPEDLVDPDQHGVATEPLDLDAEIAHFGADTPGRVTA